MRRTVLAAMTLLLAISAAGARLPRTVVPTHYAITIAPDLAKETFAGEETIDVEVREPVDSITLHSVDLSLHDLSVAAEGKSFTPAVSSDEKENTVTLKVAGTLTPGHATIHIRFDGALKQQLRGLYLSRTLRRKYAVTQFEATDARRAFPSFDEPAMKATFDITLVVDAADTAISNSPIVSDTPAEPGRHAIRFATTKPLSTYLLAMLVGDFRCNEGAADGIPIRVCSTPGMENLTAFSLSAAEECVRFYDQYFGIKYPFAKLDLIGIPDFEAGAMENAGAITFRESALLLDDKTASIEARKTVAAVVSHEIAHMWFGDLVTMAWWDDIWLNEGFATFMTRKPLAAWHPEWREDLEAVTGTIQSLNIDSQRATRAIRTHAETPEQINQLFDGIAYGKAAAVLRMVEGWLGADTFREGIRTYLKTYSWRNATAEDFWNTMTGSAKRPVDAVLKSFVDQTGAPLLHLSESCVDNSRNLKLEQERMAIRGQKVEAFWTVPLCPHILSGATEPCRMVSHASETVSMPSCAGSFFANRGGAGYYVADYAPGQRAAIREHLRDLTEAELVSFHGNEVLLVRTLREPAAEYMAVLRAIPRPASRPLVASIIGNLDLLNERLVNDANRAQWQTYVRQAVSGLAAATWETPAEEATEQRIARGDVLWALGRYAADPEVIAGAKRVAAQYISDPKSVDASIADRALALAAYYGDEAFFNRIMQQLESAPTPELAERYRNTLATFSDPRLVRRYIDYVYSDKVRTQDLPRTVGGTFETPASRPEAWAAVKAHWTELNQRMPTAMGAVTGTLRVFCDPNSRKEFQDFFATHPPGSGERALRRALENIDTCVAFREAQQVSFDAALQPK